VPLNHLVTHARVTAERAVLAALGGGCSTPIGALAEEAAPGELRLQAVVAHPEGIALLRVESSGSVDDPEELGARVAERLMIEGALEMIASGKESVPGGP
jgi:hydroxymethylbilane synthase